MPFSANDFREISNAVQLKQAYEDTNIRENPGALRPTDAKNTAQSLLNPNATPHKTPVPVTIQGGQPFAQSSFSEKDSVLVLPNTPASGSIIEYKNSNGDSQYGIVQNEDQTNAARIVVQPISADDVERMKSVDNSVPIITLDVQNLVKKTSKSPKQNNHTDKIFSTSEIIIAAIVVIVLIGFMIINFLILAI